MISAYFLLSIGQLSYSDKNLPPACVRFMHMNVCWFAARETRFEEKFGGQCSYIVLGSYDLEARNRKRALHCGGLLTHDRVFVIFAMRMSEIIIILCLRRERVIAHLICYFVILLLNTEGADVPVLAFGQFLASQVTSQRIQEHMERGEHSLQDQLVLTFWWPMTSKCNIF